MLWFFFLPDRPGLKGLADITRLSQAVIRVLRSELDRNHVAPIKGDVTVCDAMLAKLPQLREVSVLHMDVLAKFKRAQPQQDFPALHKELFSVDSWTTDAAQGDPTLADDAEREWYGALLCQGWNLLKYYLHMS